MKYLLYLVTLAFCTHATAQIKVTQGSNSQPFTLTKHPSFSSYSNATANYFITSRTEHFENINNMVVADKTGNIIAANDVRLNMGVFNNTYGVDKLIVTGNGPVVFVENHSKAALKNTFSVRSVDNNGTISNTETVIGVIDFLKMSNPGKWYVALSPDHKHIAVVAQSPHQKNIPDQFTYYLLDENFKETGKGQFSFAGNTKEISVWDFLASDKGDLYLLSEDYDQSYKLPMIYKYSINGQPTIIPVLLPDPKLRNLSYTYKVNPDGDLIIAGYTQKKQSFTAGDVQATGTYLFTTAKPAEPKIFAFEKPVTNMTAINIIFNGDTFYLIGEQFKEEKEQFKGNALSAAALDDVYNYQHNDVGVTGFSAAFVKKFDIFMSRKWVGHEYDQDLAIASGIMNNKLALIYNDEYGKYIDDKFRRYTKLPVAVLITNDGLMETPVNFAKQLDVVVSTYTLYPQFFNNSDGKMVLISGNMQSVKTVSFQ
ncbi:hypothetical protein GCM10023149_10320 [Mucilaginibacter gynuensis]|uniref:Uncharacterized protein n=1 Tax=Mucilaginibacter gynuensis TaxID=1302236 RepID=A0ABP8G010_9SPHI